MPTPARRLHLRAVAALAAPLLTVTALATLPTAARADASSTTASTTASFDYDAATPTQTFTVPAGVTSVTISASGGAGAYHTSPVSSTNTAGGAGGSASGTFAVAPGAVLDVLVAGDGGSNQSCAATATYDLACGGTGYGKGGDGSYGAGGGGASAVVTAGGTALVVAGGGGGAAADSDRCGFLRDKPGGPGGAAGRPGSDGSSCQAGYVGGAGGGAGTGTAAGAGGASQDPSSSSDLNCASSSNGTAGSGHDGGGSLLGSPPRAGAGGGGWYGGGQGASGCREASSGGGGGGSNHVDASAARPSTGTSSRSFGQDGHVTISYSSAPPASTCVPGAPSIGQATAGRRGAPRTATIHWRASASSCSTPTTGYRITGQKFVDGRRVLTRTFTAPAAARELRMTFRHSGSARWRFRVAATNANGTGRPSAYSNKVLPR